MKEEFPIEQYRQTRKWYGRTGGIQSQKSESRIQEPRQIGQSANAEPIKRLTR